MATEKEQAWKTAYYQHWNATEAARQAGYKWPNKVGAQLKAKFADEIKAHVDELVMTADEALILLSDQARGSLAEFADVQLMADLKTHPKARLLKSLQTDAFEDKSGKLHYKTRFEMYDAQAAIRDILRIHGKFVDRHSLELHLEKEVNTVLNILEEMLSPDDYQRILARLGSGSVSQGQATESDNGGLAD